MLESVFVSFSGKCISYQSSSDVDYVSNVCKGRESRGKIIEAKNNGILIKCKQAKPWRDLRLIRANWIRKFAFLIQQRRKISDYSQETAACK